MDESHEKTFELGHVNEHVVQALLSMATIAFVSEKERSAARVRNANGKQWPSFASAKDKCPRQVCEVEARQALLLGRCDLVTREEVAPRLKEAVDRYKFVMSVQARLVAFVRDTRMLSPVLDDGSRAETTSVSEAVARMRNFVRMASSKEESAECGRFVRDVIFRHVNLECVRKQLRSIEERVAAHVECRTSLQRAWLSVESMDYDTFSKIAGLLDFKSSASCLRVCSSFSRTDCLKNQLPHLSVRKLPGAKCLLA